MGKAKLPRRHCEECGRVLETRRPGVTLCRRCEEELEANIRNDIRKRRKNKGKARELDEDYVYFSVRD